MWDKPALACLSSRFPYGTAITPERLSRVAAGERVLRELGFRVCRVRFHGDTARIEVEPHEIARLRSPRVRAEVARRFRGRFALLRPGDGRSAGLPPGLAQRGRGGNGLSGRRRGGGRHRGGAAEIDMKPEIRRTLWRGARRRCPHCGRGPLFVRWITLHERCRVCGLQYLRNQGDTWLYWIVMDRIPIAIGLILIVFFGLHTPTWPQALLFFVAMAAPLVGATPCRSGRASRWP